MLKKSVIGILLSVMMMLIIGGVVGAQDKTEITYMMWGSPEELAVWQKIVDEFEAANPTIKVNVDVSDWTSYWDKLKTLMAGGTPPDVFAMDAPLYPDWQSRGVLLNLQPYIDKDPTMLDGFYPVTLEAYKKADGYYGLPRDFQTIVLFYNKDMFDAAGVAYPTDKWTMDDLKANAKLLTKDTNNDGVIDQWGFATDLYDMELFWSEAIWGFGGEIINPEGTQTLLTEGKARDAWNFISSMAVDDKSVPDPEQSAQYGNDVFAAGKAAMTTIGHWVVPQYSALPFKWDVAPMPAGPVARATSVNSAGFVVAKDSKNPDAAWAFIQYATSAAGQSKLTELGFAIPILESVAESPTYLEQKSAPINHKVFLDALEYAKPKPTFRGYDEWATVVGDTLTTVWTGDATIGDALDEIKPAADEVLAKNQS
ncbi:MAG: extracellular solute-binding protein [Anaerolineaceae bacterium]|nr:extracellular solute-binding protein [Anaerolineaceae bacterium]